MTAGVGGILILKKISDSSYEIVDKYNKDVIVGLNGFIVNKTYGHEIYFGLTGGSTATPSTTNIAGTAIYLYKVHDTNVGSIFDLSGGEQHFISPDFEVVYVANTIDFQKLKEDVKLGESANDDLNTDYTEKYTLISVIDWINAEKNNLVPYTNYLFTQEQTAQVRGVVSKIRLYTSSANVVNLKCAIVEKVDGVFTTLKEYSPSNYDIIFNEEKGYFEISNISIDINIGQNLAVYVQGVSYFTLASGLITSGSYWNGTIWATSNQNRGVLMDYYISGWVGIKDLVSQMKSKLDLLEPDTVTDLKYKKTHTIGLNYFYTDGWIIISIFVVFTPLDISDLYFSFLPYCPDTAPEQTALL